MDGQRSFKVGDVVAWADVPDGALVQDKDGAYINRQTDGGRVVGFGNIWESRAAMSEYDTLGPWHWMRGMDTNVFVTIVALGLSGTESADTLRSLAS